MAEDTAIAAEFDKIVQASLMAHQGRALQRGARRLLDSIDPEMRAMDLPYDECLPYIEAACERAGVDLDTDPALESTRFALAALRLASQLGGF